MKHIVVGRMYDHPPPQAGFATLPIFIGNGLELLRRADSALAFKQSRRPRNINCSSECQYLVGGLPNLIAHVVVGPGKIGPLEDLLKVAQPFDEVSHHPRFSSGGIEPGFIDAYCGLGAWYSVLVGVDPGA